MTLDWSTIVGLLGSALVLGAFGYANAAGQLNKLVFNLINFIGAVLLLISLSVHFNLAAFVLEVCWALIALIGLVRAALERRGGDQA